MLTQVGYALGLLLIVPFGDVMSRYQLILRMLGLSLLSLLAAYLAPNFIFFALTGLMIGLTSVVPQIIIPYAAVLAQPQ
ncbi:MFS transporter, partial [Staphylococcus epidermidis]